MSRSSRFRADIHAIHTDLVANVSPLELVSGVSTSLAHGAYRGTSRFLTDCSLLLGGFSLADLNIAVRLVVQARIERTYMHAIVLSPIESVAEAASFWKQSCAEKGLCRVQTFDTTEAAEAWLARSLAN